MVRTTKWLTAWFVMLTLVIAGCDSSHRDDTPHPTIRLRQGWFPWAGYAGEMMAIHGIDSAYHFKLQVDPGADDIDPVKMVISGTDDVGITSAESVILANQKGADLVVIAVANYKSPTCFLTLASSGITTPQQFAGKKVGILTGSETETVYRTLVKKLKLPKEHITEVEAPYDLKTFINHAFDVYPGFVYSEALALASQKIPYNIILPGDYGVQLIGAVYFTRRKYAAEHPELIQSFVNGLANGWEEALAHPDKAIAYLKAFDPTVDQARELASLQQGAEYFRGEKGRILFASDSSWAVLYSALQDLGKYDMKKNNNPTDYDNRYIETYLKKLPIEKVHGNY